MGAAIMGERPGENDGAAALFVALSQLGGDAPSRLNRISILAFPATRSIYKAA